MNASDPRTAANREQWLRKPALRAIYTDLYRRMAAHCAPGPTLEIGGGSGNFKAFAKDVISSDIAYADWLDLVCDAQALPLRDNGITNIVMFDVLHHIEFPRNFFAEAARILAPGGRIVMVEPAITPLSWPFYNFIHPEPVDMSADSLAAGTPDTARDAFDGNQAIPTLIVGRDKKRFAAEFPGLMLARVQRLSLLAYPLSGGFRPWSLIPQPFVRATLAIDNLIAPYLGRMMGFRILIVMERRR